MKKLFNVIFISQYKIKIFLLATSPKFRKMHKNFMKFLQNWIKNAEKTV